MDNDNVTIDTSSPSSIPIIEHNEKVLSSMSSSMPAESIENTEKSQIVREYENEIIKLPHRSSSYTSNLEQSKNASPPASRSQSPRTIISTILDKMISEIESTNDQQLGSLPIIEDDQMEVDDDDDDENDDNENENDDYDDDGEQTNLQKGLSNKTLKSDKEQSATKGSTSPKRDLKPITRTLRSHARAKVNLSASTQSSSNTLNSGRRVSSRRRALEKKRMFNTNEKERKRKSASERLKKDKDNNLGNDDNHTSSYSDDQTTENTNGIDYLI